MTFLTPTGFKSAVILHHLGQEQMLLILESQSRNLLFSQVAKIDIGYAKTAKKMDVKKLKAAMWGLLTKEQNENKVPAKHLDLLGDQGAISNLGHSEDG